MKKPKQSISYTTFTDVFNQQFWILVIATMIGLTLILYISQKVIWNRNYVLSSTYNFFWKTETWETIFYRCRSPCHLFRQGPGVVYFDQPSGATCTRKLVAKRWLLPWGGTNFLNLFSSIINFFLFFSKFFFILPSRWFDPWSLGTVSRQICPQDHGAILC